MEITIIEEDGSVVVATIESGSGRLMILAEVELAGRTLVLRGLHVHGIELGSNALGAAAIRRIVQEVMEELDVDEIRIEGARRTSGAGPGRAPRPLRFARKIPS